MEPRYELPSFLIKPVQRICRYPLLLQQLLKSTNRGSYPYYGELVLGVEAAKRVADMVNQKRREAENTPSIQELQKRVTDWKVRLCFICLGIDRLLLSNRHQGLHPFEFGSLQLYDTFLMPSLTGADKTFTIYLFDRILLCCQAVPLSTASKSARMLGLTERDMPEEQSVRGTVAIKGHVFMDCVTAVHEVSAKPPEKPVLKVFWRQGDLHSDTNAPVQHDLELNDNFQLKCKDNEQCRIWKERLERNIVEERKRKEAIDRQKKKREASQSGDGAAPEEDEQSPNTYSPPPLSPVTWVPVPPPAPESPAPPKTNNKNPFKPDFLAGTRVGPPTLPKPSRASIAPGPDLEIQKALRDAITILQDANQGGSAPTLGDRTELDERMKRISVALDSFAVSETPSDRSPSMSGSMMSTKEDLLLRRLSVSSTRTTGVGLRIKIYYESEIFLLQMASREAIDIPAFAELRNLVLGKIGMKSGDATFNEARLKYKDEDGDLVNLDTDEDLAVLVESAIVEWSEKSESQKKGAKNAATIQLHVV